MPIYQYRCKNRHEYQLTEGFEAPVEQECQICRERAQRVLSLPAVIFKGPGFYRTDSRPPTDDA